MCVTCRLGVFTISTVALSVAAACMPTGQNPPGDGDQDDAPVRMNIPLFMSTGPVELRAGETNSFSEAFEYSDGFGPFDSVTIDMNATLDLLTVQVGEQARVKGGPVLQSGGTAQVFFSIGAMEDVDTVCVTGDRYGPFAVQLDESAQLISSDPPSVPLRESSVVLVNGRKISVCVEVVPPLDLMLFTGNVAVDLMDMHEDGGDGMTDANNGDGCNQTCGFDDGAPDGQRAAAVCELSIAGGSSFQGSTTDGDSCDNNADCEDNDACTTNSCDGTVVKVCQSSPVTNCSQADLSIVNGAELVITFDHVVVSATVNGMQTTIDRKIVTWIAEDLSSGAQTLLIEWENRSGAQPATGCHEVDVVVQ